MFVNRFKITVGNGVENSIKIPLNTDSTMMGQRDLIDREFVSGEMENAINPIIDNEKIRFNPLFNNNRVMNLNYNLFLNGTTQSTLDQLGFEYEDVQFNLNSFRNSFLRLYFYDSEITTDQNLTNIIDLFPEIYEEDRFPITSSDLGRVKPLNQITAKFQAFNGNVFLDRSGDGYDIFFYKDFLREVNNVNLYMRADFFNAKTGEIVHLMTSNSIINVTELNNNLFSKYIMRRNQNGYNYTIDTSQNNISYNSINKSYNIDLFRVNVN